MILSSSLATTQLQLQREKSKHKLKISTSPVWHTFCLLGHFPDVTSFDSKHIFCVEEALQSVTALQCPQMLAVGDCTATNYQA